MNFWLDRGASGFRVDAVAHLFEAQSDADGKLRDEPKSGNTKDPDDHAYLNHTYTVNQPETIDMVYQWRKLLDDYQREHGGEPKVMMTECFGAADVVSKFYGNTTHEGAHMPFNFELFNLNHKSRAKHFVDTIDGWMKYVPKNHVANWVVNLTFDFRFL